MKKLTAFIGVSTLFALLSASPGAAGTGTITGKANYHEKPLEGAVVRFYAGNEGGFQGTPGHETAPTGKDGVFSASLPAGTYFLIAVKSGSGEGEPLSPGDFYAYYGGNPVMISEGQTINVGIHLSPLLEVPEPRREGGTGIRGRVYLDGEPLERARVTLYRDGDTIYRGIGFASTMTAKNGLFSFNLEPGSYYLVARKRSGSERMGPLSAGDLFAFAHENPIAVTEGSYTMVALNAVPKLMKVKEEGQAVTLDGTVKAGETTISGVVRDRAGSAVKEVYVTAYRDSMMIYKPDFISNITGEDGKYTLNLSGGGEYFIIARDTLGGPAEKGDLLGRYGGNEDHSVVIETGRAVTGIDIVVETVE